MGIEFMQLFDKLIGVGIMSGIKLRNAPSIFTPILPILYDHVHRKVSLPELFYRFHQMLARSISFTTLPETVSPQRQHGYITRKVTVTGNNIICISSKE